VEPADLIPGGLAGPLPGHPERLVAAGRLPARERRFWNRSRETK
jgi:hypothetical protein